MELAQKIGMDDIISECRRRITSGDKIWLHDQETAKEDLKNFIVDCKIIVESKKFGIDGKSFNSCLSKWKNFCRFDLKIPADIISDYNKSLKYFFSILKEIVTRDEISYNHRENFLRQLT